jgi:hypothetical protein
MPSPEAMIVIVIIAIAAITRIATDTGTIIIAESQRPEG